MPVNQKLQTNATVSQVESYPASSSINADVTLALIACCLPLVFALGILAWQQQRRTTLRRQIEYLERLWRMNRVYRIPDSKL